MRPIENRVAAAARACEVVDYNVTANYGVGVLPVRSLTISAIGDRGFVIPAIDVPNVP